jgi:hypothetical protein
VVETEVLVISPLLPFDEALAGEVVAATVEGLVDAAAEREAEMQAGLSDEPGDDNGIMEESDETF